MFWKEDFLAKRRAEWLATLNKFQFNIDGEWIDATIEEKKVEGNSLKILTAVNDSGKGANITAIRLLDTSGNIAGELAENINKQAIMGMLISWEFPIYEI